MDVTLVCHCVSEDVTRYKLLSSRRDLPVKAPFSSPGSYLIFTYLLLKIYISVLCINIKESWPHFPLNHKSFSVIQNLLPFFAPQASAWKCRQFTDKGKLCTSPSNVFERLTQKKIQSSTASGSTSLSWYICASWAVVKLIKYLLSPVLSDISYIASGWSLGQRVVLIIFSRISKASYSTSSPCMMIYWCTGNKIIFTDRRPFTIIIPTQ